MTWLMLKAPITTAADNIHTYHTFSLFFREKEKIRLDISCQPSTRHMKHQALFSSKDKEENKVSSAVIFVWRFKFCPRTGNLCESVTNGAWHTPTMTHMQPFPE